MKSTLILFSLLLVTGGSTSFSFGQEAEPVLRIGGPSCLSLLHSFDLPVQLKTSEGRVTAETARQVEQLLLRVRRALQGKRCALRFEELFQRADDSPFFPLANYALAVPPESTYRQLPVYNASGTRLGSFEARVSVEKEAGMPASETDVPFYYLHYRTPSGEVASSGNRLLFAEFLVQWEELAGRWALDTYSNGKDLLLAGRVYP